jgi:hypothetical protein
MTASGGEPAAAARREPDRRQEARGERKPRVGVWSVLAGAARSGVGNWWRILVVAVAVSVVAALAEILVEVFADRANIAVSLVAALSASGLSLLGAVFLSGFLCRLAGDSDDGDTSIRHVARTLPWWRLIRADLLVTLVVLIGLILLLVPGLIAFNLLAVTGPVIEIENRPVLAALRRSAHLVRQHFWTVALVATLPVALSGEIDALGPHPTSVPAVFELLGIRGLGDAVLEAAIGLILVKLSHRLIELDRARPADAASRAKRRRRGER